MLEQIGESSGVWISGGEIGRNQIKTSLWTCILEDLQQNGPIFGIWILGSDIRIEVRLVFLRCLMDT